MNNGPSFMNVLKPKTNMFSKMLSTESTKNITSLITGAQKLINLYNQAMPIIEQTRPMIDNIKTTFKVARAFKRFSSESSLEKAFDDLPDYQQEIKDSKVANPFYP